MLIALGILAYLVLPWLLVVSLQKQIRGSRFARMEREFIACWTRLSPAIQRCTVAKAWDTIELPVVAGEELEQLMVQALERRWQAMCSCKDFDFVLLRQDLERLLKAGSEGMMLR